jgi:hypothetical protein
MKKILIILLLSFGYSNSYSQSDSNKLIASCCEEGRGCKGSSYCSACKNCTGCKHCAKNGGTCGVCSSNTKSSSNKSKSYKSSNSIKINFKKGDILYVISNTLNLRKGPSTKFKIIEKLSKSSKVELLEISGSWLKIKVEDSKSIGYVYAKYLRIN